MEILIAAILFGLILSKTKAKSGRKQTGGRHLSDEVHPVATFFMGLL